MSNPHLSFGSTSDNWLTPEDLKNDLYAKWDLSFDPCPFHCTTFDGLAIDWPSHSFVNPPYSEIAKWLKKGIEQRNRGIRSVFLITARTSTNYWADYVWKEAAEIYFIQGRVKFDEKYASGLPIGLAVIVFEPDPMLSIPSLAMKVGQHLCWKAK